MYILVHLYTIYNFITCKAILLHKCKFNAIIMFYFRFILPLHIQILMSAVWTIMAVNRTVTTLLVLISAPAIKDMHLVSTRDCVTVS